MIAADLTRLSLHRQAEPPRLIREVRGDLDWIVMKALEKDRTRRYETANGLALDVQRYLASEPISARPPSKFYKLQKAALRNKLLFGGFRSAVVGLKGYERLADYHSRSGERILRLAAREGQGALRPR